MTWRAYYHDRTAESLDCLSDGIQVIVCQRSGVWHLLQAGERFGNERWGYMALKRTDGSIEWHVCTEKGAEQFESLRPEVFLAYLSGLDCLDEEFERTMKTAVSDLNRLRSA